MPVRASLSPLKPGLLLDLLVVTATGPKDNDGVCEDPSTLSFFEHVWLGGLGPGL